MADAPTDHDLDRLRRLFLARGRAVARIFPMEGDVSRRRYLRLAFEDGTRAVLALYPTDMTSACDRSLVSGRLLEERDVRVATVLDASCRETALEGVGGWALLEDLGERTLYDLADRPWDEIAPYFDDAVAQLRRIASLPRAVVAELNPPLDRALLSRELALTRATWLEPRGIALDEVLLEALETLCARLGDEPPVPCHRDYGARNLMPLELIPRSEQPDAPGRGARVAVIDHQDLRLGPPLYDLASLLNDSLFPPPEDEERLLVAAGVLSTADRTRYHRAAAQRTLKAVGSYAAFGRRGDPRHERLIAPTFERAIRHLAQVPETADLAPRLAAACRPALAWTIHEAP